jgi:hypothetical protein
MKGKGILLIFLGLVLWPVVLAAQDEEENPHLEMLKKEIVCLDCHTHLPKEGETSPDYFLVDPPSENCLGCHSEVEHSGIKEHEGEISMPLPGDENGKIACFTCHDPHPAGAIPGRTVYGAEVNFESRAFIRSVHVPGVESRAAKGLVLARKSDIYLRVPIKKDEICRKCHEKVNGNRWRERLTWDYLLRYFSY